MANSITFTPSQAGSSGQTFTATNPMYFERRKRERSIEEVTIPRTEFKFVRDLGRQGQSFEVAGTETFNSLAAAETEFDKLDLIKGALCTIATDSSGSATDVVCIDADTTLTENDTGSTFYFHYRLIFTEQNI